jgi:UDP-2-acetamido-2,6-beta-L-arabino-hexul-4-ose reductase
MKTILITGSSGFIGKNLVEKLSLDTDHKLLLTNSNTSTDDLINYASQADFIFHLAGMNRPKDVKEFYVVNEDLTKVIIKTLEKKSKNIPIIFTSSIHAALDNDFAKSKRAAEQEVFEYEKNTGIKSYVFRLTNTFGKWARPNAHSVIATFCYNISHGIPIEISDREKKLTLFYIDDLIDCFVDILEERVSPILKKDGEFYTLTKTYEKTLGEIADKIHDFKNGVQPKENDAFEINLYRTYLSYPNYTL